MDIDIVITWVDGNDIEWQREKARYSGKEFGDDRVKRYRDWDLLPYWFRGIERNASWVNKIHFVTYGHLPAWLNTSNPKLHIVNHKDYIPEKYLPTFSCRPIELNIHRIPELAEHFVYFNDDMYLLDYTEREVFFHGDLPCDTAILQATTLLGNDENGNMLKPEDYNTSTIYNMVPLNRNFDKRASVKKNFGKWFSPKYGTRIAGTLCLMPWGRFTGFLSPHMPYSYKKETFAEIWQKEGYLLDRACRHRFRDSTDVSSRLFSYWQIAKGDFYPRSPSIGHYYAITDNESKNEALYEVIRSKRFKLICLNDEYSGNEFDEVKSKLISCFEQIFPEKSSFEI